MAWIEGCTNRSYNSSTSLKEDLDQELKWFESSLSSLLDKHAKILYVNSFSKRWWNDEVAKAKKAWARAKKIYGRESSCKDKLRQAQNTYYHIIRKAKRKCWQKFLGPRLL